MTENDVVMEEITTHIEEHESVEYRVEIVVRFQLNNKLVYPCIVLRPI